MCFFKNLSFKLFCYVFFFLCFIFTKIAYFSRVFGKLIFFLIDKEPKTTKWKIEEGRKKEIFYIILANKKAPLIIIHKI